MKPAHIPTTFSIRTMGNANGRKAALPHETHSELVTHILDYEECSFR